jgi:DNA polymerase III subunit gamma/tau
VHMLSKAAFNALLKTLEEPPEHVKFLLATTDPQKLPVTVLSRCLQFNLKRLDEDQIQGQMTKILGAEQIESDPAAIVQLAKAADGSLRDGLSLLDQAIAYAGGALRDDVVRAMLGTVDRTQVGAMLEALVAGDGAALLKVVATLAEFSPDWGGVLEAVAEALHRIQVRQLVPGMAQAADGIAPDAFAAQLRPEVVQLWYQMALNGRRDLYLAPSPRAGFEMAVLRMLAFRPAGSVPAGAGDDGRGQPRLPSAGAPAGGMTAAAPVAAAVAAPAVVADPPVVAAATLATAAATGMPAPRGADDLPPWATDHQPVHAPVAPVAAVPAAMPEMAMAPPPVPSPESESEPEMPARAQPTIVAAADGDTTIADAEHWLALVSDSGLSGPSRQLAANAAFLGHTRGVLRLALAPGFEYLNSERSIGDLAQALAAALGGAPKIVIETGRADVETLHERANRQQGERQGAAEQVFMNDPSVRQLIDQHGARVVPDSIRPYDE